jgi:hypothetical protein
METIPMQPRCPLLALALATLALAPVHAAVGDPQVRTDHPWYPGELACSTFERLFATQAALYEQVTGLEPTTDQHRALASWLWRNTHYYHGEEGAMDLWGRGFTSGDLRTREYWTGLFAHGFGLCGTTHSQWVAEMQALFGHNRGRGVSVAGHNSFEVFLTGGPYGKGKWALLDHDLSTVIFDDAGKALLSIPEVSRDWKRLTDRAYRQAKQHGWLVCGLHPADGSSFREYTTAEYLAGYAGPPPTVHLRRGETLRRYLQPGLEDGKTIVFWGRNYNTAGVPGPERAHTWVNQPEKMFGSRSGTGFRPGQARYGNAVYVYRPEFASDGYCEGAGAIFTDVRKEVILEFHSPYVIAATPASNKPWAIYEPGCKNGLVLRGKADCSVSVSTDDGKTWNDGGQFRDGLDLTDHVKGHRQYLLRLGAGARELSKADLTITTICQANPAVLPRLKDGGTTVHFHASGRALVSAGPTLAQAQRHIIAGRFGTPAVTLALHPPRGERAVAVYAAAHVQSGNPPNPRVKYQIDISRDGGTTWEPMVRDWSVTRRGDEPKDFWSQSFCWGAMDLDIPAPGAVHVRFRNTGGKAYLRAEAHLAYRPGGARGARADATRITFAWSDHRGEHKASHTFASGGEEKKAAVWKVPTGREVQTRWVEFSTVAPR